MNHIHLNLLKKKKKQRQKTQSITVKKISPVVFIVSIISAGAAGAHPAQQHGRGQLVFPLMAFKICWSALCKN